MPLVIVFWLFTLIGHAMVSMPLAAAFGERVPDKFRDRADAWRGVGQAFGQVLGIIAAVSITWAADDSGWDGTTRFAMMVFALCLVVAGVATLLVLPFEGSSSYLPREGVKKGDYFSQYRPPKGAPKFFIAFAARMFAIAATSGIAIYQWYLAQDGLGDVSQVTMFGLSGAAAGYVDDGRCRVRRLAVGCAAAWPHRPRFQRFPYSRDCRLLVICGCCGASVDADR